jgi:hypothetical protein
VKNKVHNIQSILGLLIYFIITPTIIFISDISKTAVYNHINSIYPFYDIVFSSTLSSTRYGYFDSVYDMRLSYQNRIMSADIYMQPLVSDSRDWLSINWMLLDNVRLNENEIAMSRNLAVQNNINIGETLFLDGKEVIVVEFLPAYKGFYSKLARDGVVLTCYNSSGFQSAPKYMYFNSEKYANFVNSEVIKIETYIGKNSYEIYVSLIFLVLSITVLPGIIYQNNDLNKRKIKVFSLENLKIFLIHINSAKSLLIPLVLTSFLSVLFVYLINFSMFSSIVNIYYVGLFLCSVLILFSIHLFYFYKYSKLRSRND